MDYGSPPADCFQKWYPWTSPYSVNLPHWAHITSHPLQWSSHFCLHFVLQMSYCFNHTLPPGLVWVQVYKSTVNVSTGIQPWVSALPFYLFKRQSLLFISVCTRLTDLPVSEDSLVSTSKFHHRKARHLFVTDMDQSPFFKKKVFQRPRIKQHSK